eukprot:snap_masked-scaffold_7-processed-gene-7.3-mRNA-1 protein AED:1.00 eAED:1.00 QI:0/-1/0/0/-1/1/1/0/2510
MIIFLCLILGVFQVSWSQNVVGAAGRPNGAIEVSFDILVQLDFFERILVESEPCDRRFDIFDNSESLVYEEGLSCIVTVEGVNVILTPLAAPFLNFTEGDEIFVDVFEGSGIMEFGLVEGDSNAAQGGSNFIFTESDPQDLSLPMITGVQAVVEFSVQFVNIEFNRTFIPQTFSEPCSNHYRFFSHLYTNESLVTLFNEVPFEGLCNFIYQESSVQIELPAEEELELSPPFDSRHYTVELFTNSSIFSNCLRYIEPVQDIEAPQVVDVRFVNEIEISVDTDQNLVFPTEESNTQSIICADNFALLANGEDVLPFARDPCVLEQNSQTFGNSTKFVLRLPQELAVDFDALDSGEVQYELRTRPGNRIVHVNNALPLQAQILDKHIQEMNFAELVQFNAARIAPNEYTAEMINGGFVTTLEITLGKGFFASETFAEGGDGGFITDDCSQILSLFGHDLGVDVIGVPTVSNTSQLELGAADCDVTFDPSQDLMSVVIPSTVELNTAASTPDDFQNGDTIYTLVLSSTFIESFGVEISGAGVFDEIYLSPYDTNLVLEGTDAVPKLVAVQIFSSSRFFFQFSVPILTQSASVSLPCADSLVSFGEPIAFGSCSFNFVDPEETIFGFGAAPIDVSNALVTLDGLEIASDENITYFIDSGNGIFSQADPLGLHEMNSTIDGETSFQVLARRDNLDLDSIGVISDRAFKLNFSEPATYTLSDTPLTINITCQSEFSIFNEEVFGEYFGSLDICELNFEPNKTETIVNIVFQEDDEELGEKSLLSASSAQFSLTSSGTNFFSQADTFGLAPLVLSNSLMEIDFPPRLVSVDITPDLQSLALEFDQEVSLTELDGDFLCTDFLTLSANSGANPTEIFSFLGSFCRLNTTQGQIVAVTPTLFAPLLLGDEEIEIVSDSGVVGVENELQAIDDSFTMVEQVSNANIFQFSLATSTSLTLSICDTAVTLEVVQVAGPPVSFEYNILVTIRNETLLLENIDATTINLGLSELFGDLGGIPTEDTIIGFQLVAVIDIFYGANFVVVEDTIPFLFQPLQKQIPVQIQGVTGETITLATTDSQRFFGSVDSLDGECAVEGLAEDEVLYSLLWEINGALLNEPITTENVNNFNFDARALDIGSYTLNFSAIPSEQAEAVGLVEGEASVAIEVVQADIVVRSAGGERLTITDNPGTLVLSASRSCEPNFVSDTALCDPFIGFLGSALIEGLENPSSDAALRAALGFGNAAQYQTSWSCVNCDDIGKANPLLSLDPSTFVIEIPGLTETSTSGDYIFEFTVVDVIDNSRNRGFQVAVEVLADVPDCPLPQVIVRPVDPKLNGNSLITLFGEVSGYSPNPNISQVIIQWEEFTNPAVDDPAIAPGSPLLERPELFIAPNSLIEGITYTFRLSAVSVCDLPLEQRPLAAAEVTFAANARPLGGTAIVEELEIGENDTFPEFRLTASGWVDPDLDVPLQYAFDFTFLSDEKLLEAQSTAGFEFGGDEVFPLRGFEPSSVFETLLPTPPIPGENLVVISVVRDTFGAVSRRFLSTAKTNIEIENPFANENFQVGDLSVDLINELIVELLQQRDDAEIVRLCNIVSTALNQISQTLNPAFLPAGILETFGEVRELCFESSIESFSSLAASGAADGALLNSIALTLDSTSKEVDQLSDDTLTQIAEQALLIIAGLEVEVESNRRGDQDPKAAEAIPESVRESVVRTLSNVVSALEGITGLTVPSNQTSAYRRRLQTVNSAERCSFVNSIREAIEDLARVSNSVVPDGADQTEFSGDNVQLSTIRDSIGGIGQGTTGITVNGNSNNVTFPTNLLDDLIGQNDVDEDESVSIVAISWSVNIRCDRSLDVVPNNTCSSNLTYDGPIDYDENNVGSILTLDFITFNQETLGLGNLSDGGEILLVLDLPTNGEGAAGDTCGSGDAPSGFEVVLGTEVACGAFSDNASDWSTEGCTVDTAVDVGEGKILCRCTHASDYATWQRFTADIRTVTSGIDIISVRADQGSIVGLSSLLIFGIIIFMWADKNDDKDADKIQRAALAKVTLQRVIQRRKRMEFFKHFREMAGRTTEQDRKDSLLREKFLAAENVKEQKSSPSVWPQFLLAIRYEHSLLGIQRFDPHFSRMERLGVFFCVVISNMFLSAFLFELRRNDIVVTIYFIVAVALVSALLIALPVKVMVKLLFRTAENRMADRYDICGNLYKVLNRVEDGDGVESPSDERLVNAYRKLILASMALSTRSRRKLLLESSRTAANPEEKKLRDEADEFEGDMEEAKPQLTIEPEYAVAIVEAQNDYNAALVEVKVATVHARTIWGSSRSQAGEDSGRFGESMTLSYYNQSWRKTWLVREQNNSALKFAALLSAKPSKKAKARKSYLPNVFKTFSWIVVLGLVATCLWYTIQWIRSRKDALFNDDRYVFESENDPALAEAELEVFGDWAFATCLGILITYLVAEPLIALLRYVALPKLIISFGSAESLEVAAVATEIDDSHRIRMLEKAKQSGGIRDGHSNFFIEMTCDVLEALM